MQAQRITGFQQFNEVNSFCTISWIAQIGLMRSGRLLAEESPRALLTMYNCPSLEDVFLKLSRKQGQYNQPTTELNITNNISLVREFS